MQMSRSVVGLFAAPIVLILGGCAGPQPIAYSGLGSSSMLTANTQEGASRMPYRYAAPVEWNQYTSALVEPVVIYRGGDHQFGDMSEQDKGELARYMQSEFARKLKTRFSVDSAGARALRVKVTLTGAESTSTVLGPFLHFDIAGNVYNGVQAIRGREGAMTGYVMFGVEIFDAQTNRLLKSYVSKQYPNAMNIAAAFGSLSAAKTGIDKGADALVAQLR
jgi:hypothetical protein